MKISVIATVLVASLLVAAPAANAQMKDRQLKKELKKKVDRDSRKEAKKLIKDGWQVMPGKLPLEKQIQATKYAELDETDKGEKLYFVGTHQATGGNYTAAMQIAGDRARAELAQSIHTTITQKIESQIANTDYGQGDIKAIDEFVSASKSLVAARLQNVVTTLEIYRKLENGQYEVKTAVKTDAPQAIKDAKSGLTDELRKKSGKLAGELDKLL